MKFGVIDIGTNSMRLLIANTDSDKIIDRKKQINSTRIGKNIGENGVIDKDGLKKNIIALKQFANICKLENCEQIFCIGTAALRNAKNSSEFVDLAKKETNIDVQIISGKTEADLGYTGVVEGVDIENNEKILILDIGGGSTEFIFGDKYGIVLKESINIGAVNLTEMFLKEETDENIINMQNYIQSMLKDVLEKIENKKIDRVLGIGGTITSISAVNKKLEVYSMEKIHRSKFTFNELINQYKSIRKISKENRKKIPGLQPARADIIYAGEKILECVMDNLGIKEIMVSEYDNLEGVIIKEIRNGK